MSLPTGLPPVLCEWCGDRSRVVGSVYCSPACEEQDIDCWPPEPEYCDECGLELTGDRWYVGLDDVLCLECYEAEEAAS